MNKFPSRISPSLQIIFILLLLLQPFVLFADPGRQAGGPEAPVHRDAAAVVTGIITDERQRPLPGANIGIVGTPLGASACQDGKFTIASVKQGVLILRASMVGYDDFQEEIMVRPGQSVHLNIVLPAKVYQIEQFSVIAGTKGIFERVPGSLCQIDQQQILSLSPLSGNEVIRRSTGVHVTDEEGLGLRVNIGIRGLDPDRSRTVLVMEDGIPVSLAPYGEPEMYYTPAIDRMAGVEILKGSGSILYGPQTIGGVVNYITADPPLQQTGHVTMRGARGGFFTGMMSYGNTFENTGYQVSYLRKQADSIGLANFRVNDLTARVRTRMGDQSSMNFKLGIYDETSNSTYVGITQTMYDAGGKFDFARIAPDDVLHIRRYSMSLTHNHFYGPGTRLTTTAYGYTTSRNWQRQDFAYNSFDPLGNPGPHPSNFNGIIWGDETVERGAIYMRNSTGNRNRQFEVAGLESRLTTNWVFARLRGELKAGGRFLYERAYEQRMNGQQANASSGTLQEDEIRTGYGHSAYVHTSTEFSPRFSITSGVRVEHFSYERDIRRGRFNIEGQNLIRDTLLIAGSSLTELIPGLGFNLNLRSAAVLFGGIHRGFAPPRVKDAVSNSGFVYHLDAEKSWNYEVGVRQRVFPGFSYEMTAFYMAFSNQVIPVAESSGGAGAGAGLINGGSTLHRGLEAAFMAGLSQLWDSRDYELWWDAGVTLADSRFGADRYQNSNGTLINIRGNKTPYAPSLFANSSLMFEHQHGVIARITMNYTGAQYSDILNTVEPSPDGRSGLIDRFLVVDANFAYTLKKWGVTFNISGKNLTNHRYIVTRRPQGIRLGLPRMVTAGFRVDL